jgi:hypothetical protein
MILIPVSIGELLDKISILQIKLLLITNDGKIAFIRKEHTYLMKILCEHQNGDLINHPKYFELYHINLQLWNLEDDIRLHEKNKDFGPEFIRLARSIYKTNDRRAATKKFFNDMFQSEITEVKSYEDYS